MRHRVRASPSLIFFWRRMLGSYLWAEGAVKCHPQNDDGGVAIEVLSASVWVYPSVLVLFGIYVVAVVTAVLFLRVTHSESVQVPAVPVPVRANSERGTLSVMFVMGKAGHRLQQGLSLIHI